MKNLTLLLLSTLVFTYIVNAQELSSLREGYGITVPQKIYKSVLDPLPAGIYTVGTGGFFPSIDSAFNKLSIDGIAGPVTLELIDHLYTAPAGQVGYPLLGPIPGAGPDARVTIKPAANKNVIIQGNNQVLLDLYNVSYTTLDGVGLSGSTTLTIYAGYNVQYQWNDAMSFYNNSDHNIVQNITFISDDNTRYGSGLGFYTLAGENATPDSNLMQYNNVSRAGCGIYLSAGNSPFFAAGNILRGNSVGSETDSLISWGIQLEHCQNTIVEYNIVQNLKSTPSLGQILNMGINSFRGYSDIIRNNIVRNMKSTAGYSCVGIFLSGDENISGVANHVYNNMVYNIQSTSTHINSRISGIQMWYQINPKIHYNSVYLSGAGFGANLEGSAALYIYGNVINSDVKNNILINTRDETPYCASAICDYSSNNLTSDYNDLYYEASQYNCLVKIGANDYHTLAEWQTTGNDLHSVNEMPNFAAPYLHINQSIETDLEKHATPIAGVLTDFDGDVRNVSFPDIGADEFNGVPAGVLITGTYTVGSSGSFSSLQSAFDKLSTDGIAGEITLELTDTLYTAPTDTFGFRLIGPVPGAGLDSRLIMKPAADKKVTIWGSGRTALSFENTSYVTIDGLSLTGSSTLTIHTVYNNQFSWNDCLEFLNNSDYNIVKNITFISEDYSRYGIGPAFWTLLGSTGTPDYNLIENNFIKEAGFAIYVSSYNTAERATGNIIRGNLIGSETDSLLSWGIQTEHCLNAIIENNHIQNVRGYFDDLDIAHGINSYWGQGTIIRNNVVHNIRDKHSLNGAAGILLSGAAGNYGNSNMVYNNMVYDIQGSPTPTGNATAGIHIWRQSNTYIYYNTVFLSGTGFCPGGSGALYINEYCSGIDVRNNVLVNTRDDSPHTAAAIRGWSGFETFTSDYNDLYYIPGVYSCLVYYNGYYLTLQDWQTTGKDLHSGTEMPHFIGPYLHIDETYPTFLEKRATPIAGILNDIDGEIRNTITPDIGADEFDGIVGVDDVRILPAEFSLGQNYPNPFNPNTTISYSIPEYSKVTIQVFDILGNEIEILFSEEKPAGSYELTWTAADLPSGVYFYRLQAGGFVQTKKMILMK